MKHGQLHGPAAGPAGAARHGRFSAFVARLQDAQRRQALRRELGDVPDALLCDMGVRRADLYRQLDRPARRG